MVIANIPVTLLFPVILVGGIVVVACNLTGICDVIPAEITNVCCNTLDTIARWLAEHFGAADGLYLPFTGVIIGYLAIMLLGIYAIKRRRLWLEASGLAWILFFLSFRQAGCQAHEHSFIYKSHQSTTLVHTADGIAHLYPTALLADRPAVAEFFSRRYKDYLHNQGVKQVIVETDDTPTIAGKRYAIPELTYSDTLHVDYLIVGRKFRGNIDEAILIYSPDSVLLGSDLDKRKTERYINVLESTGTRYKVLKR